MEPAPSIEAARQQRRYVTPEVPPLPLELPLGPDTFRVEELPRYAPTGAGDHVWFRLGKRGLGTREALARIGSALGRREREFGYAGLKDAGATTVQWCSLEHEDPERIAGLELSGLEVDLVRRSDRKLRVGWSDGNRFEVLARGAAPWAKDVRRVLDLLERRGVPNVFGPQRFGRDGRGFEAGRKLLLGDAEGFVLEFLERGNAAARAAAETLRRTDDEPGDEPLPDALRRASARADRERAGLLRHAARALDGAGSASRDALDWSELVAAVPARTRRFALSALQSRIFNRVVDARLMEGADALGRLEAGDLAFRHRDGEQRGALFEVDATELAGERGQELRERLERFELSPSGPLFGTRTRERACTRGRIEALERAAVEAEGLALTDFTGDGAGEGRSLVRLPGARRPLRVPLRDASVTVVRPEDAEEGEPGDLRLAFALPAGSFATVVLQELRKRR